MARRKKKEEKFIARLSGAAVCLMNAVLLKIFYSYLIQIKFVAQGLSREFRDI
jgi:hypothetical protein